MVLNKYLKLFNGAKWRLFLQSAFRFCPHSDNDTVIKSTSQKDNQNLHIKRWFENVNLRVIKNHEMSWPVKCLSAALSGSYVFLRNLHPHLTILKLFSRLPYIAECLILSTVLSTNRESCRRCLFLSPSAGGALNRFWRHHVAYSEV